MTVLGFLLTLLCPTVTYQTVRPDLPGSFSVAESLFKLCSFNSFHNFALLFKKHLGGVWDFFPLIAVVIASDSCRVGWVSQLWCLFSLAVPIQYKAFSSRSQTVRGSAGVLPALQERSEMKEQEAAAGTWRFTCSPGSAPAVIQ